MHALNIGKHFKWLANPQSCQSSLALVALVCDGLLECRSTLRAQHSHLPLEIKQEKVSEHFQQALCSGGSITPAFTSTDWTQVFLQPFCRFLQPFCRIPVGHPDGTRRHLQWQSAGQMKSPLDKAFFCTLNLVKCCTSILLKDCNISPETRILWDELFPPGEGDDAQGLFECQSMSLLCVLWT